MKRELTKEAAAGMTVNERLYLSGLLDDFEKAVAKQYWLEAKLILEKVHLDPESAEAIIRSVFME